MAPSWRWRREHLAQEIFCERWSLRAVQGDQHTSCEAPEVGKPAARFQRPERTREHPEESLRRHPIEHVADVVVRRDLLHGE